MSHPGKQIPTPESEVDEIEGDEPEVVVMDEPETPDAEPEIDDEDDEPEPEGGDEPENPDAVEAQPEKRLSRSERRIQKLAQERATERAERERLERELNEIRAERQGRQTEEAKRAEEAKLQYMSPEEKFEYLRQKDREEFDRKIGMLAFQQQDVSDRTAFESLCARKPHLAEIADDVERELANMRRQAGTTAPRQTIAYYLLGKRADERAGAAKTRQKKKGEENIRRQTSKPGNAKSDTGSGSARNEKASRDKRLENIIL